MAAKKMKKDFDKEQMYSKIMPSFAAVQTQQRPEPPQESEPEPAPREPQRIVGPKYLLRNYMEDIVLEKIGHTMNMLKACTCERCKKDIMALALNELPTAYRTVSPDEVEAAVRALRSGAEVKVSAALIKAVQTVKANPRHEG